MDVKIKCYLGVIEKWHKKEGDVIKRDDVICDIRTKVLISCL
jgi:pyruvate/2-oxoglutarate dehydrogenase complex dihydrolipoamide acyltransferase (E2) component